MRRRLRGVAATSLLALIAACLALAACGDPASSSPTLVDGPSASAQTSAEEAAAIGRVLADIAADEPGRYPQDVGVFQNREGLLPEQPLGYYREYTVETPGSPDRGARRLVTGAEGEVYYTRDHYASFLRIDPEDYQ